MSDEDWRSYSRQLRSFSSAQRAWDNMLPPEDDGPEIFNHVCQCCRDTFASTEEDIDLCEKCYSELES